MGKGWDKGVPGVEFWAAALRVAKPGAHLMAFGGTRTHHRLMCAIEDAGWELRDCLMWLYGTGFPKSHDVSKAIDKAAGVEREKGELRTDGRGKSNQKVDNHGVGDTGIGHADGSKQEYCETLPTSLEAKEWDGWGTALKPAWEPIIVAMKPVEGTFAENAQKYGVAGLHIDGARVGDERIEQWQTENGDPFSQRTDLAGDTTKKNSEGRWPANVVLDEAAAALLDEGQPVSGSNKRKAKRKVTAEEDSVGLFGMNKLCSSAGVDDSGGPSRFYYCAKAGKTEKENGLRGVFPCLSCGEIDSETHQDSKGKTRKCHRNFHPTVKPLNLMKWLVRLTATPTGGVILDPFMGSGSTGVACAQLGRSFIGSELSPEYTEQARQRIAKVKPDEIECRNPTKEPAAPELEQLGLF
jgi:site-specific DNA-methyltransferase (adenine-specific)